MKNLFLALALMFVGTLAFADNEVTDLQSFDAKELNYENNKAIQKVSYSIDAGICTAHVTTFNSDGEATGSFDVSWESDSASACEAEVKTFALWINGL